MVVQDMSATLIRSGIAGSHWGWMCHKNLNMTGQFKKNPTGSEIVLYLILEMDILVKVSGPFVETSCVF